MTTARDLWVLSQRKCLDLGLPIPLAGLPPSSAHTSPSQGPHAKGRASIGIPHTPRLCLCSSSCLLTLPQSLSAFEKPAGNAASSSSREASLTALACCFPHDPTSSASLCDWLPPVGAGRREGAGGCGTGGKKMVHHIVPCSREESQDRFEGG